ncbi:MAG: ROK family protein [Pyrinomonadaceae bacterium]
MNDLVLAADLGGTNLRMATVDRAGRVDHLVKRAVPDAVTPDGLMTLIDEMFREVNSARDGESYSEAAIRAVAFTAPSPVPEEFDGILTKLPNLGSITGMNFKLELEKLFALPVVIENDATAAAIGEHWIGASQGVDTCVTVTLGTGIGGGIIVDGKPLRGKDGIGGEIGHITVEPGGRACKCRSQGCVEEYASATALARIAREHNHNARDSQELFESWESGDPVAVQIFDQMGRYLGQMLAGLANALNPEMFVICGGVAAGWDAFAARVQNEITARAYPAAAARAKLVRGQLGDTAGIIGVARSAFQRTPAG